MLSIDSPLPSIRITPAPPEKVNPEPYSPIPSAKLDVEDDGYRAKWLSLPPLADTSLRHSSPLRPAGCPPRHKGLSRDQFNSLLKMSRDQRVNLGTQKKPDLRKELALKSQALKQLERHARFLSKVKEPPCTATIVISVPEVSLESPHCPISPRGFEFEFSTLEAVATNPEDLVVKSPTNLESHEQVERSLLIAKQPLTSSKFSRSVPKNSRHITPSLDEITARLKPVHESSTKDCSRSRLPNFLKTLGSSPMTLPVRSFALNDEKFDTTFAQQVIPSQHPDPRTLKLGSRRAVIPRTANVVALAGPTLHISRADTARDMIVTLKRRSSPPPGLGRRDCTRTAIEVRRRSAPAEL